MIAVCSENPLIPHASLPVSGERKVGLGTFSEHSRQILFDLGAKGPGGLLQVPALPLHSLLYPKTSECLLVVAGTEGRRLQAASDSCL